MWLRGHGQDPGVILYHLTSLLATGKELSCSSGEKGFLPVEKMWMGKIFCLLCLQFSPASAALRRQGGHGGVKESSSVVWRVSELGSTIPKLPQHTYRYAHFPLKCFHTDQPGRGTGWIHCYCLCCGFCCVHLRGQSLVYVTGTLCVAVCLLGICAQSHHWLNEETCS